MVLKSYFSKNLSFIIVLLLLFAYMPANADVLFDGYYKIVTGNKPVGYVIQRYDFDAKKKIFNSTYYIKAKNGGQSITESLKAKATDSFQPISYQYTSVVNGQIKVIDAQFKSGKMSGYASNGKNKVLINKTIPKGTFLSTFLGYMMLKKGVQKGKKFSYSAVAEEEAVAYSGEAFVDSELTFKGIPSYKVLNKFKNTKFISYMAQTGDVLATQSPLQQVGTELMDPPTRATEGFVLNSKDLTALFGKLPSGKSNALSKLNSQPKADAIVPLKKKLEEPKKSK